jgi:micrococcal nuclease
LKSLLKFSFKSIITIGALILIAWFAWKYAIPKLDDKQGRDKVEANVTKVLDGDTFEVLISGKKEKVRMLGIDTPEKFDSDKLDRDAERTKKDKQTIRKLGELASDYTTRLIGGKRVVLIPDPKGDEKDKYDRLLRYVYLEDGTFVNLKLIEDGYATAFRRFNVSKQKEFVEAEADARKSRKGLWGDIEGSKYLEVPDK